MAYLSNIEKILANWLGAGVTEDTPHSRVEDLLIQVRNASSGATHYEVVTELPTTNIQTNVMYFVPKSEPEGTDKYDEYINTTGDSTGWEKVGSTEFTLNVDPAPTSGSANPVSSGGVFTALGTKMNTSDVQVLSESEFEALATKTAPFYAIYADGE